MHPQVALQQYRAATGIQAKLVVVGMVSNRLTIADPSDSHTLNLAGFDTSTPEVLSMLARTEQSAAGWRGGGPCSCAYRQIDCGVKPRNALGPGVRGHHSALREHAWRRINQREKS